MKSNIKLKSEINFNNYEFLSTCLEWMSNLSIYYSVYRMKALGEEGRGELRERLNLLYNHYTKLMKSNITNDNAKYGVNEVIYRTYECQRLHRKVLRLLDSVDRLKYNRLSIVDWMISIRNRYLNF